MVYWERAALSHMEAWVEVAVQALSSSRDHCLLHRLNDVMWFDAQMQTGMCAGNQSHFFSDDGYGNRTKKRWDVQSLKRAQARKNEDRVREDEKIRERRRQNVHDHRTFVTLSDRYTSITSSPSGLFPTSSTSTSTLSRQLRHIGQPPPQSTSSSSLSLHSVLCEAEVSVLRQLMEKQAQRLTELEEQQVGERSTGRKGTRGQGRTRSWMAPSEDSGVSRASWVDMLIIIALLLVWVVQLACMEQTE
jgi:hypothetical protein